MSENCANPDIAGPGVVISFVVAALLTTACSIAAAIIDGMILSETAVLPVWVQSRLNRGLGASAVSRLTLWRETLDRLILSLADQQLVTGMCLLISGALFINTPSPQAAGGTENDNFTLVICLASLASSSHLASLITLKKYFWSHPVSSYVRVACILVFAFGLTSCILVDMKSPFSRAFYMLLSSDVYDAITTHLPFSDDVLFGAIILYTFYVALVQLFAGLRARIAALVRRVWRLLRVRVKYTRFTRFVSRHFPEKPLSQPPGRAKRAVKRVAWFLILGSSLEAFLVQVLFATASLVFLLFFRYTTTFTACFDGDDDVNSWGLGQTLPMLLLLLPFLSTLEFYFESKEQSAERKEAEDKGHRHHAYCEGFDETFVRVSMPPQPAPKRQDSHGWLLESRAESDLGLRHFQEQMHDYQQGPGAVVVHHEPEKSEG